jgi:hypothetical protein
MQARAGALPLVDDFFDDSYGDSFAGIFAHSIFTSPV